MGKIYLKTRKKPHQELIPERIEALNTQIQTKQSIIDKLSSNLDNKVLLCIKMEEDINKMIEKWESLSEDKKKGRTENPILRIWRSELRKMQNSIKELEKSIPRLKEELEKVKDRLEYYERLKNISPERGYKQRKHKPLRPNGRRFSKAQRKIIARKKLEKELSENKGIMTKPFESQKPGTKNVKTQEQNKIIWTNFVKKVRKEKKRNFLKKVLILKIG